MGPVLAVIAEIGLEDAIAYFGSRAAVGIAEGAVKGAGVFGAGGAVGGATAATVAAATAAAAANAALRDYEEPRPPPPEFVCEMNHGAVWAPGNPNRRNRPTLEFTLIRQILVIVYGRTRSGGVPLNAQVLIDEFIRQASTTTTGNLNWGAIFGRGANVRGYNDALQYIFSRLGQYVRDGSTNRAAMDTIVSSAQAILQHRVACGRGRPDASHAYEITHWEDIVAVLEQLRGRANR